MPHQAAVAINELLDECARLQPGQQVLIVAAPDGLHGGINLVDEAVIGWVRDAVELRGALPSVLWADMPARPPVVWDRNGGLVRWQLPRVLRAAMESADVVISHSVDLSFEEELKEVHEVLAVRGVPFIRNMATTAPLLTSPWGQAPYRLISEIRFQTASLLQPGARWTLTHPGGTRLEGTVNEPPEPGFYTRWRYQDLYRPFPEGVFPAFLTADAEGVLVFKNTGSVWARHIGVPPRFEEPVTISVANGRMTSFKGGREAAVFEAFYASMEQHLGDDAYLVRGVHGGLHPYARIPSHLCPDPVYREFIDHHHWSSLHVHLGQSRRAPGFPYNLHVSAELRGASLRVGDQFVYKEGRLSALDRPTVQGIAGEYPNRPGLDPELWSVIE